MVRCLNTPVNYILNFSCKYFEQAAGLCFIQKISWRGEDFFELPEIYDILQNDTTTSTMHIIGSILHSVY